MPYGTRKGSGGKTVIYKKEGGGHTKVVGHSTSQAKADASIRARYANEGGKKKHKKRKSG